MSERYLFLSGRSLDRLLSAVRDKRPRRIDEQFLRQEVPSLASRSAILGALNALRRLGLISARGDVTPRHHDAVSGQVYSALVQSVHELWPEVTGLEPAARSSPEQVAKILALAVGGRRSGVEATAKLIAHIEREAAQESRSNSSEVTTIDQAKNTDPKKNQIFTYQLLDGSVATLSLPTKVTPRDATRLLSFISVDLEALRRSH